MTTLLPARSMTSLSSLSCLCWPIMPKLPLLRSCFGVVVVEGVCSMLAEDVPVVTPPKAGDPLPSQLKHLSSIYDLIKRASKYHPMIFLRGALLCGSRGKQWLLQSSLGLYRLVSRVLWKSSRLRRAPRVPFRMLYLLVSLCNILVDSCVEP